MPGGPQVPIQERIACPPRLKSGENTAVDGSLRRILHVDMDAFYASVEQRDRPELKGKPVAVGGSPESRGVVMTASYEARPFGVHSAMPMARALRLCPELMIVPPDFRRYKAASDQIFDIFRGVTPLVEPLSLDEAYLDVTQNSWGETLGVAVARRIKDRIRNETGLTASAGVAPNKFLAKIASGWKKPDGLTVIAPERVERFLAKLPVDALWGVGPKTAGRLREIGVERLIDVRTCEPDLLRRTVGSGAATLRDLSFGIDDRPVVPNRPRKSIGCEETYARDLADRAVIGREVEELALHAAGILGRKALRARTVTLKLRYANFETITRSHTRDPATGSPAEIAARAVHLLEKTEAGRRAVRLLGVSLHGLIGADPPPSGLADAPALF
jgi:DNA polymerase IV